MIEKLLKNKSCLICCALIIISTVGCSTANDTVAKSELKSTYEHDMGVCVVPIGLPIDQIKPFEHVFEVSNDTKQTLELNVIYKSCACVEHMIQPRAIQPGERGSVGMKFVYGLEEEYLGYSMIVGTNLVQPKEIEFLVGVKVIPAIQLVEDRGLKIVFAKDETPQLTKTLLFSRRISDGSTANAKPIISYDSKELTVLEDASRRTVEGDIERIHLPITVKLNPGLAATPIVMDSRIHVEFGQSKLDFDISFERDDVVRCDTDRLIFSRATDQEESFILTGIAAFSLGEIKCDRDVFDISFESITESKKRIAVKLKNQLPEGFESKKFIITIDLGEDRDPIEVSVFVL